MKQNYSAYTQEDFEVWSLLFIRQYKKLEKVAAREYIEGIGLTGFSETKIPDFAETDKILEKLTGWKLQVVPNIIPGKDFFELLNRRRFPATTWLRRKSQLDYLEEPDMFHDVFGHVPLLTNRDFCNFFHGLSEIALKHIDDPYAIELLGRIYWFTIEFGLIKQEGPYRIYGAGILSSPGETDFCMGEKSKVIPYDAGMVLDTSFRTDVFQERYFVIDSFEQLLESLPEIERELNRKLRLNAVNEQVTARA
jgi:phenylalanine-4-hydroxylase